MRTIYKYPFEITDIIEIEMPKGAQVLHFNNQHESAAIWCLVDPDAKVVED